MASMASMAAVAAVAASAAMAAMAAMAARWRMAGEAEEEERHRQPMSHRMLPSEESRLSGLNR
eukprot:5908157-Prymnesium_polylepis.2